MTPAEMTYACTLVAEAVPFGLFLGILVTMLRSTWRGWP